MGQWVQLFFLHRTFCVQQTSATVFFKMPLDDECTNRWNSFLDFGFFNEFHHKPPFFTSIWEKRCVMVFPQHLMMQNPHGNPKTDLPQVDFNGKVQLGEILAVRCWETVTTTRVRKRLRRWKHPWVWLHPRKLTWTWKWAPGRGDSY